MVSHTAIGDSVCGVQISRKDSAPKRNLVNTVRV